MSKKWIKELVCCKILYCENMLPIKDVSAHTADTKPGEKIGNFL